MHGGSGGRTRRSLTAAAILVALVVTTNVLAPGALSAAISQGYSAAQKLQPDTLVAINPGTNQVQAADTTNSNSLLGVVVGNTAASLAINAASNQLQVATTGGTDLFVTDLNGPIKVGDQIAPSPIKGVGMEATQNGKVVGVAQAGFNGSHAVKTVTITNKAGQKQQVHIGVIPVMVQVVYFTAPSMSVVPSFLQQFADTVAGKPVAAARLLIVGLILAGAILLVAIVLFSAVRGSIVSIGRNPLAKQSIYRGLFQATAASVAILMVAVGGAYIVLTY